MRLSTSLYGKGSSTTARTTLYIAVVAMMPRASDSTASSVNAGARTKVRRPYRRS